MILSTNPDIARRQLLLLERRNLQLLAPPRAGRKLRTAPAPARLPEDRYADRPRSHRALSGFQQSVRELERMMLR